MGLGAADLLLVDPETEAAHQLSALLTALGARTSFASSGAEALERLDAQPADVVITELSLPDMTGLALLACIEERWPGAPVIMAAQGASVADVVAALRAGAADFLEKPFNGEQVGYVVGKALTSVKNRAPLPPPPPSSARAGILGESAAMRQAYATLRRAAQGTATVLVRGESGTGKELVARAIHDSSPRADQPFVKIDCTAFPEALLESELFGYERGAFTGAVSRKPGRVELADKGTLFLDEIGELGLPLQAKLLRLLQDRQLERLGGNKTIQVDVRVVAATHRDLDGMIERGQFRLDLFYRLNVVPLWLPPLRARRDDIELLALHFCKISARANGRPELVMEPAALRLLRTQRWPGNVRQLQNFIERLVVLASEPVMREDHVKQELVRQVTFKTQTGTAEGLATDDSAATQVLPRAEDPSVILPLDHEVREAEKKALARALKHCKGNRSLAARLLGVSRSTLYTKLQEHGLL